MALVKKWHVSLAIVLLILGVLIAVQLRTQFVKDQVSGARTEFLLQLYRDSEDERKRLETEVDSLRSRALNAAASQPASSPEVQKLRLLAGMTAVSGPGVVVTLDDSQVQGVPGGNQDLFVIHDEDLLGVLNELWDAGAEAVSINGQRLVANSEVRCAGPTTSVNKVRIGVPFVISAIGDPNALSQSMSYRGGVVESLKVWGIRVRVDVKTGPADIYVPPYRGSLRQQYAKPVVDEEQKAPPAQASAEGRS